MINKLKIADYDILKDFPKLSEDESFIVYLGSGLDENDKNNTLLRGHSRRIVNLMDSFVDLFRHNKWYILKHKFSDKYLICCRHGRGYYQTALVLIKSFDEIIGYKN